MRSEGFDNTFEITDLTHSSVLRLVTAVNSRPLKYANLLLQQICVRKSANDALAARTVVLPNMTVTHRVIKPQLIDHGFEIAQPNLGPQTLLRSAGRPPEAFHEHVFDK